MKHPSGIAAARAAAAEYLRSRGYGNEADIVSDGKGDDFQEVRIALALWDIMRPKPAAAPPATKNGRRIAGEEC
jgi:hypothetical protein